MSVHKNMNLDIDLAQIKKLNIKCKAIKFLEEYIGEKSV